MRTTHTRWILSIGMACALLASACASLLSPHAPQTQDPQDLDLTERRAQSPSLVADPDPAPLSAWTDAGAPPVGRASPVGRAPR